jgi:hypothetical protein
MDFDTDFDTDPESPYWMDELRKARSRIVHSYPTRTDRPKHYYKSLQRLYGSARERLSGIINIQHLAEVERWPFMQWHYRNLEALGKAMFSTQDRDIVIQDARDALDNWQHRKPLESRRDQMEFRNATASLRFLKRLGMDTPESNELWEQMNNVCYDHTNSDF